MRLTVNTRKRGEIGILDLKGDLIGSWALDLEQKLSEARRKKVKNLLLNFKNVTSIDSLGVNAIVNAVKVGLNIKIVYINPDCRGMLEKYAVARSINIYKNAEEALDGFGAHKKEVSEERRRYRRVDCNIPAAIGFKEVSYPGILLNISEGGVLLGYLDPFEKRLMVSEGVNLSIRFPNQAGPVRIKGKMKGFDKSREVMAVGIELVNLQEAHRRMIEDFVLSN